MAQVKTGETPATSTAPAGSGSAGSAAFQIPKAQVDGEALQRLDVPAVHSRIQTEFESDRGYHMIAERIIAASQKHLADQQRDKVYLRKKFTNVFSALLVLEYLFLVVFILLDGATVIPVDVPDSVLQLYVGSVFLQTLTAMGVMIAFSFASKEETRIVGLLNEIIQNYQKVTLEHTDKPQQ